jgi:hypothetical protein
LSFSLQDNKKNIEDSTKSHACRKPLRLKTFANTCKDLQLFLDLKIFTTSADTPRTFHALIYIFPHFSPVKINSQNPPTMEPSSEVAVVAANPPVVTKSENSVTESSQESKVEQVANGTVETSVNSEKTVSQSVQSSVQASGDQNVVQKR